MGKGEGMDKAKVPQPTEHPMKHLLDMQKELMDKVPHDMRPGVYNMSVRAIRLIESILLLLAAHGHKPWRPVPLEESEIADRTGRCHEAYTSFISSSPSKEVVGVPEEYVDRRSLISTLGVIEESVEYLNATMYEQEPERLEEVTDILFFYLELVVLGRFSWAKVEAEYARKHAVNLERYRRAEEGDYGWDERGKKEGL